MKMTELKMLWKLVKSGEDRPLTAVDMTLPLGVRFALKGIRGEKRATATGV